MSVARFSGKRITLLVTGSIAAYKSAEVVRALVKEGALVRVAMSKAACEFITPLTLQTLSKHPVTTDLLDPASEAAIGHIALADETDLVLVAPATADSIAKAAYGFAESIVGAVLLATKAPIVMAPAMNVNMWQNALTQRNVETLRGAGVRFVEPGEGELACGWYGAGRFAELEEILSVVAQTLNAGPTSRDRFGAEMKSWNELAGVSVIVTAGPTREYLDPIRFISNRSSGKMGFAIARAAARRGAKVQLITGPTALEIPRQKSVGNGGGEIDTVKIETAEEMRQELNRVLSSQTGDASGGKTVVFMVAAVMDYRAESVSSSKLKHDKTTSVAFQMKPNPDILRELGETREVLERQSGRKITLVGFCAETGEVDEMLKTAREKYSRKRVQLLIANRIEEGFERDTNHVWILDERGKVTEVETASKDIVAERILNAVVGSL